MIIIHKRNHLPCRRAFTILELIVAIAITVIMLFLINALFQATSTGVSMGMALSDVIGAGRAIGDQVERDVENQLGPTELKPGVLFIVCEKRDGIPYKQRGMEKTRPVRSDQFLITRAMANSANGFGSAPVTPLSDTTFSSASKADMGETDAIRIWYGHVQKTNEAGLAVTEFGSEGRNKYANEWILGRHALYFKGGATLPTFNHSLGATASASLSGHVTGGTLLFHGITDVAYLSYSGNPAVAPGAFVATGDGAGSYSPSTLWTEDTESAYHAKALSYMFISPNRLWANPFPVVDAKVPTTWVTAGQVAQMHPILTNNVSDFIVEFAADAVPDADVSNDDADGFDGEPDRDSAGEVIWYGLADNANTNSKGPPNGAIWTRSIPNLASPVVAGANANRAAYVFRHGVANKNVWPYMVRIRYRIHDTRALLEGDRSLEVGDGTNSGRWFEQIFTVKRD